MAQNVSNLVGNTPEVEILARQVLEQFNNCSLYADENSTIFGRLTMLVFDNSNKYFPALDNLIITRDIINTNSLLSQIYGFMKNLNKHENTIIVNKIISSNNGERSFDIQVFANIMMNGENKSINIYINLTQGSNKVQKKEKIVNKFISKIKEAELKREQIALNMGQENMIENITEEIENLKQSKDLAEENLQQAIRQHIESFWIRKFSIMFLS